MGDTMCILVQEVVIETNPTPTLPQNTDHGAAVHAVIERCSVSMIIVYLYSNLLL